MLEGAYLHSFAVWDHNDTLPYFLALGTRNYQEINLAEEVIPLTREFSEDDHDNGGYVTIVRPTAFLHQQKNAMDESDNSEVFEFDGDARDSTSTKRSLYHWNDGDQTW